MSLPSSIRYVDGLACKKCGHTSWNTFSIATTSPFPWPSDKEWEEKTTRWNCGVTGEMKENGSAIGEVRFEVEAFCCDCGQRWWSRDRRAIRMVRGDEIDVSTIVNLEQLYAEWEANPEDDPTWSAANEECAAMLARLHEMEREASERQKIEQKLAAYATNELPLDLALPRHWFIDGYCIRCGKPQQLAERFGWNCSD